MNIFYRYKQKKVKKAKLNIVKARCNPSLFDYCYCTCNKNLSVLNYGIKQLGNDNGTLLDIGCGMKPFENLFSKKIQYIGVEHESNETTKADIFTDVNDGLPFDDDYFDFIIISEVLEHLNEPYKLMAEIKRVLKDGGYLYITTPFIFGLHSLPYDYFRYTSKFYEYLSLKYELKLLKLEASNSIISLPFGIFNNIIQPIPCPNIVQNIIHLINNCSIILLDGTLNKFYKYDYKSNSIFRYFYSMPIGYAVLFRK